jgi:hypothetical protein
LTFGFVGGTDFGDEGFDELLEVDTVGVFGGVAETVAFVYGVDVLFYGHLVVLYISRICFY